MGDETKIPEGYTEPFQVFADQWDPRLSESWWIWPDGFATKEKAEEFQRKHANSQRAIGVRLAARALRAAENSRFGLSVRVDASKWLHGFALGLEFGEVDDG